MEPLPRQIIERLFADGHAFDFFQAVRLLHALAPGRPRVGHGGPPPAEAIRFRVLGSLCFPPSTIHDLVRPPDVDKPPILTQSFFGLTGPNGVLPRHYTELLIRLEFERRDPERHSLRDWLDLFNHRFVSLFYRAWEKYRLYLEPERTRTNPNSATGSESDNPSGIFESSLLSLIGLGTPALRDRLIVNDPGQITSISRKVRIDDPTLIYYAGLIMPMSRSATGLKSILQQYFGLKVEIVQFSGRWLNLAESNQSRLGNTSVTGSRLGVNTVIGERVWDVQGFFRVRVGPLMYAEFVEFLPNRTQAGGSRKAFLMAQLIRFFVGIELDFDIQLVLRAREVPQCLLPTGSLEGPILGWNSWLANDSFSHDADDAAFDNAELDV